MGEALDYIIASYTKGKKHSFEVLNRILEKLGNPQERLRVIHVSGTNGKGSTCAFLYSVLRAEGYRTGLFTSPHLHTFNERYAIDGELISDGDFSRLVFKVKDAAAEVLGGRESLSYFEILTIVGFCYFYEEKVDFLVLEVGLGGRLDATNVIKKPVLSIITSIGLDHMNYLGDTIPEICREKGGIIKENSPVVLYFQSIEVYNIIVEMCRNRNSKLYYAETDTKILKDDLDGIVFNASNEYYSYDKISIKMVGAYQRFNAQTALLAITALRDCGIEISDESVFLGMENARWPGRMEILSKNPIFILDGAHNYDGARMFNQSIERYLKGRELTLILGILSDKEYNVMVNLLAKNAKNLILTKPLYAARTTEPTSLYAALTKKCPLTVTESDYRRAVDLALKITPKDGLICCTGSLYLVGDVRKYLLAK